LVGTSGIDAHAASFRVHDAVVPQLSVCPVLVGRDAELAALRTALVEAEQGRGGVVLLAGPAGIGKSRLLRGLLAEARLHGDVAVAGRAVASASATPFRPLAQALLQAMRGGSFAEDVALHPWWSVLRQILPLPHVELGIADASMAGVDLLRQEAVLRLVRALAATAPLVIGLEDLQWADADTVGAVEYMADNLGDVRVLCLVTVRSEPRSRAYGLMHALVARRSIQAFSLDRLSRPEAAAMVRACRSDAAAEDVERVVGVADGVPFLIEELLAAPGVPETFAASVAARLAYLTPAEQRVVEVAALLGRHFPWRLLPGAAQEDLDIVGSALQRGVEHLVLSHDGDAYRFRHALTREAVLERLLPHVRAVLARHALSAVTAAYPGLPGSWRGVAAELAQQAGDLSLAVELLLESGRDSLGAGALATAVDTLLRARDLAPDGPLRGTVLELLVAALALAGRADECTAVGAELLDASPPLSPPLPPSVRAATHLWLAHAAVEATRWPDAGRHLACAEHLLAEESGSMLTQRYRVLAAETAMARRDLDTARHLATLVVNAEAATPEVRCQALALLGRSHRARSLDRARAPFEEALACAETARLPLWRLRALHELGTVDLFDHAGVDRLAQARRTADELGALSTAAVLDIQLAGAHLLRFEPDAVIRCATSALDASGRLRSNQLRATALAFLAEAHGLRQDGDAMERHNILALAAAPRDAEIAGSVWGGRGVAALLADDRVGAARALRQAVELLTPLENSGPGLYLGFWPLLLAMTSSADARAAIGAARSTGMTVNRGNRGLLLIAEAVLAGRSPTRRTDAEDLLGRGRTDLVHFPVWSDLALLLAAQAAVADGWGQPRRWLAAACETFERHGLQQLLRRGRALAAPATSRLATAGLTPRETEIVNLVRRGLSNRQIATYLTLSHRTVEKHVESLLRKTGAHSRTHLVSMIADADSTDR
jgi:DNA-binding CsgD family transcriptional regulator